MTMADKIVAEALSRADSYSSTHIPAQLGEDLRILPKTQTAKAWEVASITLSPEQLRARRARSVAIALALGTFVLLIYAVTIVRVGSGVLSGPDYMRPGEQ
jgi:hypothetical protein